MIYYLPHFPNKISPNNCKSEFLNLLKYIKPEWPPENIYINLFNKGTTNSIISASLHEISDFMTDKLRNHYDILPVSSLNTSVENNDEILEEIMSTVSMPDVILIRIYGNMTEVIIDRKKEIENMVAMWSIDCGSELFCSFNNGLCYDYAHGITVSTKNIRNPQIYPLIAQKLAQMHFSFQTSADLPIVELIPILSSSLDNGIGIKSNPTPLFGKKTIREPNIGTNKLSSVSPLKNINAFFNPEFGDVKHELGKSALEAQIKNSNNPLPPVPCFFPSIKKWASLLIPFLEKSNAPQVTYNDDAICQTEDVSDIKSKKGTQNLLAELPVNLWKEIEYLEEYLLPLNSPVVYCHNDLLLDNIIYNPVTDKMLFIDLEYGDFNFQAFDIAHFFCEFAGLEIVDYSLFPDRNFRRKWLALYLEEWEKISKTKFSVAASDIDHKYSNLTSPAFPLDSPSQSSFKIPSLDEFMEQVDKFILAPHLYWAVWAILQSQVSEKTFDYLAFAKIRLNEYLRIKLDPNALMK